MAVQITRLDMDAAALRREAACHCDANAVRRILAIAMVPGGTTRKHAAESCGMDRQTLRDRVHRYIAHGIDGLSNRKPPGRAPLLTAARKEELAAVVREGPDPDTGDSYRAERKASATSSIVASGTDVDLKDGQSFSLPAHDIDSDGKLDVGDIVTTSVTQRDAASGDDETWGVGFQIGAGGFTLGASYTENDNAFNADQQGYSVGVSYDAPGPWTFGLETYQGEYDGTGSTVGTGENAYKADETWEAYQLGASRALGPGVTWQVALTHVVADDEGTAGTDLEGTILSTALNLSF